MICHREPPSPLLSAVLFLALSLTAATAAGKVTASLSHNPVHLNETFELIVEYTGEAGGAPDLSGVKRHFDVLSQGSSQSIRVINGQVSRKSEVRLTLMPREPGEYRIPGIAVDSERSEPIRVEVLEPSEEQQARTSEKVFLEVGAAPEEGAPVQSQILYTVRLYRSAHLTNLRLPSPETEGPYTVVERLGDSREYEKTLNGVRYRVSELRYALFPQTPGVLKIKPITFTALEVDQARSPYSPFGYSQAPGGRRIVARSEPVEIRVKPIPAGAPAEPWLPASNLQLAEAWPSQDPELRVGQPITRTLMMLADGLPAAKLPKIEPDYPQGLKTYGENATLENRTSEQGLTGVRQERTTIVPTEEGRFRLPEVEIEWWNVQTGRRERATLPSRSVRVLPSLPGSQPQAGPPASASSGQQYPLVSPPPSPWTPREEPPLDAAPGVVTATSDRQADPSPWLIWLTLALGIGWVATAAAWWTTARGGRPTRPTPAGRPKAEKEAPLPPALQALERACAHSDRHGAQEALLAWGRQTWPEQPVTSLGALAELTPPRLGDAIRALDRALYGEHGASWNCQELWEALRAYRRPKAEGEAPRDEMLTPLNPPI